MNQNERLELLKSLRLFDDVHMKDIFKKHKECVELVVRIVLDNKDLEFVEYKDQEIIQNKNGKSSVLDFVIRDKDGKCYDVEIESAKGKTNPEDMFYDILRKAREEEMLSFLMTTGRPENELLDKYLQEAEDKGKAEGIAQEKLAIAKNLLKTGLDLNTISQSTGISLEELKKL